YSSQIHAYVEAQLQNRVILQQFEGLRRHLDQCPDCAKFYMAWYDTMRRQREGTLPAPDLPFTQEIALAALARLSDRPSGALPSPPTRPSPVDRFAHRPRHFFVSPAFHAIARRTATAAFTLLVATFALWALFTWDTLPGGPLTGLSGLQG